MPQVKAYNYPQVDAAPIPGARLNVRASPDAFGAPVAQGLQNIASAQEQVYFEEKRRADETNVQDKSNWIKDLDQRIHYGNDQAPGIYHQNLGKEAYGAVDRGLETLDTEAEKVETGLANDTQKRAFRQWYQGFRRAREQQSGEYAYGQKTQYEDSVHKATLDSIGNDVLNRPEDDINVGMSVSVADGEIRSYGQMRGTPAPVIEQQAAEARSRLHTMAISAMLDKGDDISAANRYKSVSAEIQGEDKVRVEKELEIGSIRGQSQRMADAILAANPTADLVTLSEKVAAEAGDNAKLRDAVQERIEHGHSVREAAKNEKSQNLYNSALTTVLDPANPRGLDAVPTSDLAALREMDPERYARLQVASRKDTAPVTDWGLYYKLRMMAANQYTQKEFTGINILDHYDSLAPPERKELIDLQMALANKATSPETAAKISEIRDLDGVTRETLGPLGINPALDYSDPTSKQKANNDLVVAFQRALQRRVQGIQSATGRPLTREQVQKEADALVLTETYKVPNTKTNIAIHALSFGFLYANTESDVHRYAFQNPAIANEAQSVDQIPEEEIPKIARDMNAENWDYDKNPDAYMREQVRRYNLRLGQKYNAR